MASPAQDCRNVTVTGANVVPPPSVWAIVVLLIISGVTLYILLLIYYPTVPEFQIDSAIFSPVNATGSELTATWDLTFGLQNSNHKFSISYEKFEVAVLYGRDFTVGIAPALFPAEEEHDRCLGTAARGRGIRRGWNDVGDIEEPGSWVIAFWGESGRSYEVQAKTVEAVCCEGFYADALQIGRVYALAKRYNEHAKWSISAVRVFVLSRPPTI